MTDVSLMPRRQPSRPAGPAARPPLTLAEEHVLLLWQVTASADKLLAAAAQGRWPGTELTALAGYARAEVLRQVSDEEALLFPAVPAQTAAGLTRDHVRLRSALSPDSYQFTVVQDGPAQWQMRVTRREGI